jgi:hypothetical protein
LQQKDQNEDNEGKRTSKTLAARPPRAEDKSSQQQSHQKERNFQRPEGKALDGSRWRQEPARHGARCNCGCAAAVGERVWADRAVVFVAVNGNEQDKLTWDAKPFCAVTDVALVKVAVWPAFTVCVVVPVEVMEKSGARTVKLTGWE